MVSLYSNRTLKHQANDPSKPGEGGCVTLQNLKPDLRAPRTQQSLKGEAKSQGGSSRNVGRTGKLD